MVTKPEKADDDIDALEALESEEKEYLKVSIPSYLSSAKRSITNQVALSQDAEIDRILKAFRLDAYVCPLECPATY